MKIAFDIDGVFTDYEWFLNAYGERYLKRHKKDYLLQNPEKYTFRERFGCSEKIELKFFSRYLFWYAKKMPVRENVSIVIKRLKEEGHSIHIITARALADRKDILGRLMRFHLRKWLSENKILYDSISYVSMEHSAAEKVKLCREQKIDIFVEDDPENIVALRDQCRVICIEASYNQSMEGVEHAIDFGEVYQLINDQGIRQLRYHDLRKLKEEERKQYLIHLRKSFETQPFDAGFRGKYEYFIRRTVRWIIRAGRFLFPVQIEGKEYLKQKKPAIYVCNHRSYLDIILCYCILGEIPARFLAKKEIKWYHFLQRRAGTIFVVRENKRSRKASKNTMIHTLLNGGNVLLYPEGTRNRTKSSLLPFRLSAVYMAQITGCPIVPIVIRKEKDKFMVHVDKPVSINIQDDLKVKNDNIKENMCRIYKGLGQA